MSLLSKKDITTLIRDRNIFQSDDARISSVEGHIQPASIDVTVGQIFVPPIMGKASDPDGQEVTVCNDYYILKPGSVALVKSQERLTLPVDLGAFVFPKNGDFALKAVMFTNFGHIDPGFNGHLKFTVINMGGKDFWLKRGERIAGLVLFSLSSATDAYVPKFDAENFYTHAKTLPRVFLDIDSRVSEGVKTQAKAEWNNRETKNLWMAIFAALLGAALGLGALIGPVAVSIYDKFQSLSLDQKKLEEKVETYRSEIKSK